MRLLLCLAALIFALPIHAADISIDAAYNLAKRYCQNPSLKKIGSEPSSPLRSASIADPAYFIFSDDATNTFCIVSGDGEKTLGYGDNYSDELPPVLQLALDKYAESPRRQQELRSSKRRENIPPFMDVVFGTRFPYNKFIPEREGSGPPVGCVPVALAQICKYYEHPSKLMNDIPPYSHYSATDPDSIFHIEGQKAEGRTYNWDLILNNYKKDSLYEETDEIGKLMWDCARSVETMFAQSGSSALTDMFYYSLIHFFGYNSDSLKIVARDFYYREAWLDIIHEELSKKRPIYMSGTSYKNGGHAFICDGYNDGFLHINWGWNGSSNGYFDVDIFDFKHNSSVEQTTPDNGYSFFEKIIIGIEPGVGKSVAKRPESSSNIVKIKQEGITTDTRYRATNNGFKMYTSIKIDKKNMDEDIFYAIGHVDKNGRIAFWGNGLSDYFLHDQLILESQAVFDSSLLGKDVKLIALESDHERSEQFIHDSIYDGWSSSVLIDTITITIPDTIANDYNIIEPIALEFVGEYADSSILLNVDLQTERAQSSMKYYTLAIVSNGDTLMSESNSDISDFNNDVTSIHKIFKYPVLDEEMTLIMLQTDNFSKKDKLDAKLWSMCENFEPVHFKLSDCTIFSKELKVDTIFHSSNGTKQRFEVVLINPTPFEFYNDIYFLVDNNPTGLMITIPAGDTITEVIERDIPVFTKYINGLVRIYNYYDVAANFVFTKDTFSHVFYGFQGGDENTISMQILNGTNKNFENTIFMKCGTDTVASQETMVEPLNLTELNFSLPIIVGDSNSIRIKYREYTIYDKDNNALGVVAPLFYNGALYQSTEEDEKIIYISLSPAEKDSLLQPIIVGIASSLEDTSSYERLLYTPSPTDVTIHINFKLSDYCTIKNPKYIGLCKEDGTFYAYMELIWDDDNSSVDIPSNNLSIHAVDGGIWISSDVEIPSLPIYNIDGKIVKTVDIKPYSTQFVPLRKGVYIVEDKKIIIRNS